MGAVPLVRRTARLFRHRYTLSGGRHSDLNGQRRRTRSMVCTTSIRFSPVLAARRSPIRQHDGIKCFICPGFLERDEPEPERINADLNVRDL